MSILSTAKFLDAHMAPYALLLRSNLHHCRFGAGQVRTRTHDRKMRFMEQSVKTYMQPGQVQIKHTRFPLSDQASQRE